MKKVSRRKFIGQTGAALAVAAAAPSLKAAPTDAAVETVPAIAAQPAAGARPATQLIVNGAAKSVEVQDRWTLADVLRDQLGLTGTKIGCDRGECGACTVLLDGTPIYACSYLAVWAEGKHVTTIEGLASGEKLDPLQEAFIEHDGPQCGFCTSGQLMTAKALLTEHPKPTVAQVKSALAGNICRCSNYNRYVEAVMAAAAPAAPAGRKSTKAGGAL